MNVAGIMPKRVRTFLLVKHMSFFYRRTEKIGMLGSQTAPSPARKLPPQDGSAGFPDQSYFFLHVMFRSVSAETISYSHSDTRGSVASGVRQPSDLFVFLHHPPPPGESCDWLRDSVAADGLAVRPTGRLKPPRPIWGFRWTSRRMQPRPVGACWNRAAAACTSPRGERRGRGAWAPGPHRNVERWRRLLYGTS